MSITWNGNVQPSAADASREARKKTSAQAVQRGRDRRGNPRSTEAMRASIPQSGTAQGFRALLHFSSLGRLRWDGD
jgi:hypothetical protein